MLDWYPSWEYPIASAQLVATMLGIGATLSPRDFRALVEDPRGMLAGFGVQLLFVPLAALVWTLAFQGLIDSGMAFGLLIIAAVPGGSLSNIFTWLGRGNVALSIALTGSLTIGALVTTPLILELTGAGYLRGAIEVPVRRILFDIGFLLLLPLAVGMFIGDRLGEAKHAFAKTFVRLGLLLVGLIVVGALGSGRIEIDAYGWSGPLWIVGFSLFILWGSRLIAWAARTSPPDRVAVALEATARNSNFALLIAVRMFPAGDSDPNHLGAGALFTILFFGGNGLVVGLIYALESKMRASKKHTNRIPERTSL